MKQITLKSVVFLFAFTLAGCGVTPDGFFSVAEQDGVSDIHFTFEKVVDGYEHGGDSKVDPHGGDSQVDPHGGDSKVEDERLQYVSFRATLRDKIKAVYVNDKELSESNFRQSENRDGSISFEARFLADGRNFTLVLLTVDERKLVIYDGYTKEESRR